MITKRLSFHSRLLWTILLTIGVFFVVSQIPLSAQAVITLTEQSTHDTTTAFHSGHHPGQTFTVNSSNGAFIITEIFIQANGNGSANGSTRIRVYTTAGGSLLCISESRNDSGLGIFGSKNYRFTPSLSGSTACPLLPDGTYFFQVESTTSNGNNPQYGRHTNDVYAGGTRFVNGSSSSGDMRFIVRGTEEIAPTPTPTPTPSPTPLPTPTSTPHAQTPVIVHDSETDAIDCLPSSHPDFPAMGRLFIQPFEANITAQVSSVTMSLARIGVPTTPLFVSLVTMPEIGTPTVDDVTILATGSITAAQMPATNPASRTIQLSPNPGVVQGTRYGVLFGAFTGSANRYCIGGEADTTDEFYASEDEGETWTDLIHPFDSFTASLIVNGFTFASGYFPSNPAQEEPAPNAPDAYETYIWSWTNAYINTPLAYEFATVTADSTFIVRRLNESGSPVQNLGSYTVTSASPFFVHETVNQSPGPFEVFDSTNNRRLVKHYLLPEPPNAFKDNRPHRADSDFAVGHGDIVYRTPATSTGRQHNAANPLLSIQRFGTYTFLHYRLPDLEDPSEVFLSVRDANSLAEIIRVSIEGLALYNNWNNGGSVANFNDSIYFQNFVVLNTNGNNLPFVQNFDLLSIVGATLEQGTYNYALVDEDNVVLSEGESILIVLNDPLNPWALSANKSRYVLGETARYTFTQQFEVLFSVWNNFIFESCCGEIPDLVSESYQQTQTLSFTHPETWPNPLPATILTFIRVAPSSLPYAADPVAYAFNYNVFYDLLGACNVQCRIENLIAEDDRFIFSLLLMIALGITAIRIPVPIVGVLEVILFAGLAVLSWIPETAVIVIAVLLVLVALVAYLIRGNGGA